MKKIYVLNGLPRSGKTTFGQIVGECLRERGINFLHASSIDPVKSVLQPITNWGDELRSNVMTLLKLKAEVTDHDWSGKEEDKTEYWRRAMSELKMKITYHDADLIHELVLNKINLLDNPYVAFVDIREPENILGFRKYCEAQNNNLKVEAILVNSDKSMLFNNSSDTRVNEFQYDVVIENPRNTFVDDSFALWFLRCRAKTFVEQEILEGRPKERFY